MPPNRGKRKHPGGGGGRGRGGGGRDAAKGRKGGKGEPKPTREEVKALFKQRKYTKNNYPMQKEEESSSEEEQEEAPGEYDQLLSAFGGNEGGKAVDSESESSDEDDSELEGENDNDASEDAMEDDTEAMNDISDDGASDNELENKEDGDSSAAEDDGNASKSEEEDNDSNDDELAQEEDNDSNDDELAQEESGNVNEEKDQCSDDEQEDTSDPFTAHFETDLHESAVKKLKAGKCWSSSVINWPELGSLQVQHLDWTAPKTLLPPDKAALVQQKLVGGFPDPNSSIETLSHQRKVIEQLS